MIERLLKFSWGFALFKIYVNFIYRYIHYRKVEIIGKENIPKNCPIIFVSNHQNSLMDPLALVLLAKDQVVSLARADIFKKPFFRELLHSINILPVYRQRDKVNTVEKNEEIFQILTQVLAKKKPIIIMPEGNNAPIRKLRLLKKGFARIAFKTEAEHHFTLDTKIVPIGLEYSSYTKSRSKLYVKYAEPISIVDYKTLWEESPEKANLKITTDLSERLKSVIVDLPNQDVHNFSTLEVDLKHNPNDLNFEQRIQAFETASQRAILALEEKKEETLKAILTIEKAFKGLNEIPQHWKMLQTKLGSKSILLNLICFPFIGWAFLHHFPMILANIGLNSPKVDKEFTSTFKLVAGIVILPLLYLIYIGISFSISDPILQIFYLLSIPFSAFIALYVENHTLHLALRIKSIWKNKNENWKKIQDLEKILFDEKNQTVEK